MKAKKGNIEQSSQKVSPVAEKWAVAHPFNSHPKQLYAQLAHASPQVAQLNAYSAMANGGSRRTMNQGGLPTQLQSGIESLSGIAMNDVRVHYNSSKPAQLQAHAYAQGSEIHLAPGQERHLPHEAWHVVQQKQDRVKPTLQMKGIAINDNEGLEREADVMGAKAMQHSGHSQITSKTHRPDLNLSSGQNPRQLAPISKSPIAQLTKYSHNGTEWKERSSSSSDTDTFPDPEVAYPNAAAGDTYDRNTGVYVQAVHDALDEIADSSGAIGFYDHREPTGYKFASGKNRQGPHILAHISKRVAMGAGEKVGRDPAELIGSAAAPRPRRMNKMLRDRLKERGPNWRAKTRKLRTRYLKAYIKQWLAAQGTDSAKALKALRKLMELNPATVYNIGSGVTSHDEIKGKGERRELAAADWKLILDQIDDVEDTDDLQTIDVSGATDLEEKEGLRLTNSIKDWLKTGKTTKDDGESESDSEIDDLDAPSSYGPIKTKKKGKGYKPY